MVTTNKIALITGGNKGIGLETARQLGHLGITVLVGARDASKGEEAAQTLRGEGLDARFVPLDVTDAGSLADAAQTITQDFGHLDILVNNAGVGSQGASASEETPAEWVRIFATNVFGVVAATEAFLPLLRKSEAGRIVNLSSILGSLTYASDPKSPIGGWTGHGAAYGASKSALNMYTVHLAADLKDTPIKVNAAHPGWVKTDMGGEQAPLEVPEGAKTSVQLATIPADGPTGSYFHLGEVLPW
jgi:NAD(P)-dependent dehydrogenase (short-subunit alcohol dehydrogenase family)